MKKLFAIAIAAFLLTNGANAQLKRNVDPAQKVQRNKARSNMKNDIQKLDLSQDQKGKMKIVLQDARQQRDAIKNDASLSQDQKAEKMKQLKATEKQKVSEILTPTQRAQAKDYFADRKENKDNDIEFGKKYQKEIASLNLSESQKDQLKSYVKEGRQQREAIKNDATLTPAQKKAKMKDVKADAFSKMESILTPEQRAKAKVYIDKERGKN
ncbi:MAG: hypothetical protein ABI204_02375 [Ginsengibacter sp.]